MLFRSGIGTTTPSKTLSVQGNGLFSGDLSAANITATGTLNVTGLTTLTSASTTNLSVSNNAWIGGNATTTSSGDFTTNGIIKASNGTALAPAYGFTAQAGMGFYWNTTNQIGVTTAGGLTRNGFTALNFLSAANNSIGWVSDINSVWSGSLDTAIVRTAAGIVEVNNGTSGVLRDLTVRRDRKSTRLNSSHIQKSRMPSSA